MFRLFALYVVVVFVMVLTNRWSPKDIPLLSFSSTLVGGLFGRGLWVIEILKGLYKFDDKTKELRARVEKASPKPARSA
jgi:hypothetical protein